jgi:hypothetical protein
MLQSLCSVKHLKARVCAKVLSGENAVALMTDDSAVNAQLVTKGQARVAK